LDRQSKEIEDASSKERSLKNGKQEDFRSKKFLNFGSYGNEMFNLINHNKDADLPQGIYNTSPLSKMNVMD